MKRREFLCALGALSMGMFSGNASFAADLKILVAYFSATGTTKGVAESIARAMGGDLYRIEPEQPYTDADLDWHDKQSRSSVEMADKNARPAIRGALPDLGKYDAVFLGYPIWWAVAPRIMSTFAEKCSLQGKTVAPFCTSGGSAFAKSADMLIAASAGAKWLPGKRLMAGARGADIEAWLKELGLK